MREKAQVLDQFWLKIAAIVFMTCDHVGAVLLQSGYFGDGSVPYQVGFILRVIGRLAFPLFALCLAEGLRHSHDRGNYLSKLALLWAIVEVAELILYFQPSYSYLAQPQAFSDLLAFALLIYLFEKGGQWRYLALLPLAWVLLSYACDVSETYASANELTSVWSGYFPTFLRCGYSLYGLFIFLGFYYAYPLADAAIKKTLEQINGDLALYQTTKEYRSLVNLVGLTLFLITTLIFWGLSYTGPIDPYSMGIQSYGLIDIFFLVAYTGKRGYDSKAFRYFEYAYYPLHLALIGLIFGLLFR
jgi:hypothetical protein